MSRRLGVSTLLILVLVGSAAPSLHAQGGQGGQGGRGGQGGQAGRPDLDVVIREIQSTPTTVADLRRREMVISRWAQRLKAKCDIKGVYGLADQEALKRLIESDPEAAARKIDGIIQAFSALDSGAGPALPAALPAALSPPAPRIASFPSKLRDARLIELTATGGAPAGESAVFAAQGRFTVTLSGSPVAIVPAGWTNRAPDGRSGMLGVLGDALQSVADEAPRLGYGMVKLSGRSGLNWAVYRLGGPEIPAGPAYLEQIARKVELAQKSGLEVLLVIEPSAEKERRQAALTKQEMKARKILFSESDVPAYREFLKTVFARFPTVKLYALGNESDVSMPPEDYARALLATYDAMKSQRPECELVTSGYLLGQGTDYFDKVFKVLDGRRAFDHFDMRHIFGFYRELDLLRREYAAARELLDRSGYRDADIWMTETSAPARMPGQPETSDEAQAAEVIKRHLTAFAIGVKRVLWTGVVDLDAFGGERQGYYSYVGLATNPAGGGRFEKRASYFAYRALSDIVAQADMRSLRPIEAGESVTGYTLNAGIGPVYILWRTD